ncbi:galactose-3-O-sulfotransferase 2-like, partial [Lineus longissimus]|uniref:galactose-3-O-sulfotransferase 2-like n=1 Tax=Lineus longissimus TaxID=88925 RepID=UPI00315C9EA2
THIAFVKVHKCASSTIGSVLIKFGYQRHLLFGLPTQDGGHIGWPRPLLPEHVYRLKDAMSLGKKMDMIVHHAVFSYKTFSHIMPSDTIYLAVLREPFEQFHSALNFFTGPRKTLRLPPRDFVANFLQNPDKYEKPVPFWFSNRMAGTKSITHNMMATDLGYPPDKFNDIENIKRFISFMDKTFSLVMIKEYFFESLVLMRRRLCWEIRDILFIKLNSAHKRTKSTDSYPSAVKQKYYNWSKVDYEMYKYFRNKFLIEVKKEGSDFVDEVNHFLKINEALNTYCKMNRYTEAPFESPESRWNERIVFKRAECSILFKIPYQMTKGLKESFDLMVPRFEEIKV